MDHITLKDIAKKAGVSRSAVSLVLNKKYSMVGKGTRDRILKIADELNYRPNQFAKSLKTGRTNIIGVTYSGLTELTFFENPYLAEINTGIGLGIRDTDYKLVFHIYQPKDHINQTSGLVASGMIEGLIFVLFSINLEEFKSYQLDFLKQLKVPFVVIHSLKQTLECPSVGVDCELGGYQATRHLIQHGYNEVAYVCCGADYGHYHDFYVGYRKAISESGTHWEIMYRTGSFRYEEGKKLVEGILQKNRKLPRAFFVSEDVISYGILHACQEKGIAVPEEVALIGFGDNQDQDFTGHFMTSVKQPGREKGKRAAAILQKLLDDPGDTEQTETITLEPELNIRKSCGC